MPPNEVARLAALRSYRILDTAPEPDLDGLTKLAANILNVPIALISIIDSGRQWFKSRYGLTVPETPRDVSFCGHVVETGAPLEVRDAFDDERFHDNPLVTGEPRVRFYAGMPLRGPSGLVLGTFCAIDHVPRTLSAEQRETLNLLARQVMVQLELHRFNLDLAVQERRERDLRRQLEALLRDKESLLQDKELLLAEIQHRVKNNLQLMMSMLNLQQCALGDDGPGRATLEQCCGRIQALAVVYDMLYRTGQYGHVALPAYVRGLTSAIMAAISTGSQRLELEVDDVELFVGQAIPCGLILNELLTNSLKHAFPGGRSGTIRVVARRQNGVDLLLQVSDDGVGLSEDFERARGPSIGMQLVAALADQLGGQLAIERGAVTCFRVIFPLGHAP